MSVVTIARDRDHVAHGCTSALVASPEPPDQVAALSTRKAQFTGSRAACQAPVSSFNDRRRFVTGSRVGSRRGRGRFVLKGHLFLFSPK
jgi:hypothetical protein